ncbi:MAG: XdhC family protein [Bacteroidales bacterium]|nr:XdhC family protein [Bacteroidales bacterium]MDD4604393.1 XdhC family protein [Bacteroidales bacterium]
MDSVYTKIEQLKKEGKRAALCILIDTEGSTPRKPGAKMIVYPDGQNFGSIGGGSVEKEVVAEAVKLIETGISRKCRFKLEQDLGMHCGGTMEVYIEPLLPNQRVILFGAGHIGREVAQLAREFDFSVTAIDPRENIFQDPAFNNCTCLNKDYFDAIAEVMLDAYCYLVIVTPKHVFDEEILAEVARKPHAYLGMIGSKSKVNALTKRFLEENILTREELEKIDMPIGIKFNAQTPREIALSIVAKLIDVRNSA